MLARRLLSLKDGIKPRVKRITSVMRPATTTVSIRVSPFSLGSGFAILIWLFVVALVSPAWTEENGQLLPVTFLTDPPGAEVYRVGTENVDFLGLADGGALSLSLPSSAVEEVVLRFKVPQLGGKSWTSDNYPVPVKELKRLQRYPSLGRVALRLSAWQRFQADLILRPWRTALLWFSGPLLAIVALLLLVFRNRWIPYLRARISHSPTATRYGDYVIKGQLGKGAMGVVYLAEGQGGVEVALKSVLPELAGDQDFAKRFEHEIRTCISLNHSNLLRYFGHGIDSGGVPFSVTERLRGNTLKQTMTRPIEEPPRLAIEIMEQIGDALDYLHAHNLVHRDVKPDNIFACDDGQFKLLDLGLVKGEALTVLTRTGFILGTPAYMAPEQFDGQTGPRADQYSLGVILYELLAGKRPFLQADMFALAFQHKTTRPEPPSNLEPRITPQVDAVLLKMLSKRPEERFPNLTAAQEVLVPELLALRWFDSTETFHGKA